MSTSGSMRGTTRTHERSPSRPLGTGRTVGMAVLGLVPALVVASAIGSWAPWARVDRALAAGLLLLPLWSLAVLWLGRRFVARRDRPQRGERRTLMRLHLELGGVLAPLVFVLCFSGAMAVAARSLAAWEHAPRSSSTGDVPAASLQPIDRIVEDVLRQEPEAARGLVRLAPATPTRPWIRVELRRPDGSERVVDFDPTTGEALGEGRGPLTVIVELHRNLLVPAAIGQTLVTSLGVLVAVVLVCGLATRRRWSRELIRLRLRRLPQELHKLLGAWTLAFGVGAALTGAMLGGTPLSVPVMTHSAYGGDQAALFRDVLGVERVPLDDTAAPGAPAAAWLEPRCFAELPASAAWQAERIVLQHPGYASARVTVEYEGPGPWLDRGLAVYDATGRALRCRALRQQSAALQSFYATVALHYGQFGGQSGGQSGDHSGEDGPRGQPWVELLWIVAGLALAAAALLGELVRVRRLEREGISGAGWRGRALVGLGLGLPLATVTLLLLSRVAPHASREPLVGHGTFLLVWAGAWLWSSWPRGAADPRQRTTSLAMLVGLGLLTTAASSLVVVAPSTLDLLWACLGLTFVGASWSSRRSRARTSLDASQGDP
ncbi:PepSY-associated TM helix domain-containing protein [Paraliomyxa miuraensis]|uniref:PepSY-associated TM helix domain-containing protein n=1 Tax=Paraliomyxa miuraensis TaxID=376150 RepID=UPI00225BEBCD|nr:PepSY-associated TM helix domain-containing protein [Paraliomyxa miuraensis]MCX4239971.1 PepSY domain-containing protein [Paraliomyxa miuraensis]